MQFANECHNSIYSKLAFITVSGRIKCYIEKFELLLVSEECFQCRTNCSGSFCWICFVKGGDAELIQY